jgi:hypothetical protein
MTAIFLWDNRKIIGEVAGAIALGIMAWWFFIHNPAVIDGLERDKTELSRQVAARDQAIALYADIEKGKVVINESVHAQISSIHATARPRRAVIIRAGVPMPAVHK